MNGDTLDFAMVAAGTALVAGLLTIPMGLVANFPMALAAGLGLNAFVTYSIANQMTWADAMGLVVIEGVVILVLVLTGFREAVFNAVPVSLKVAISVGIGLFITLIGLVDAGFVNPGGGTPLELGVGGSLRGLARAGLLLRPGSGDRAVLAQGPRRDPALDRGHHRGGHRGGEARRHPAGLRRRRHPNPTAWNLNVPAFPDKLVAWPDFGLLGEFNLLGSWENVGVVTVFLLVFTLLLTDFFDTMGTMTAVGAEAGLNDETGVPPHTRRILVVDSVAAIAGGAASRLLQHLLHRVDLRRRRGRPHRALGRGHRRALPARDVPVAGGGDRAVGGGGARRWCWSAS